MLLLLEHGARDVAHLSKLAAPMSGEELLGVAEERALAGRCGNPLCANAHSLPSASAPRRRWDPAVGGAVELPPPSHFCGAACESLVQSYAAQLGDPLERLKPGVRQLLAASHQPRRPGMESVAAQGGGVATMMAEIVERDPTAAAAAAAAGGAALDRLAASGGGEGEAGAGGAAARRSKGHQAVEGYVPAAVNRRPATAAGAGAGPAAAVEASTPGAAGRDDAVGPKAPTGDSTAGPGAGSAAAAEDPTTPAALKPSLRRGGSAKAMGSAGAGGSGSSASAAAEREPAKRVTFGPKVEYQVPASGAGKSSGGGAATLTAPSGRTEQPVLLFDVDEEGDGDGDGDGDDGSRVRVGRQRGPAMGPRGTLRVAEAAEVLLAGVGPDSRGGLTDEELAAALQAAGALSPATPSGSGGPRSTTDGIGGRGGEGDGTDGGGSGGRGSGGGGGGLRRFLPQAPPRRKVVYLDPATSAAGVSGSATGSPASSSGRAVVRSPPASSSSGDREHTSPSPAPATPAPPGGDAARGGGNFNAPTQQPVAPGGDSASGRTAGGSDSATPSAPLPSAPAPAPAPVGTAAASTDAASPAPGASGATRSAGAADGGRGAIDPWAPWAPLPPGASASASSGPFGGVLAGKAPQVRVVHVPSGKRPPGGGVPIPPENQPYFSEEEGDDEDGDGHEPYMDEHDDRDADEVADDLYSGTLRAVDDAEEEEQEVEKEQKREEEEEAGPGSGTADDEAAAAFPLRDDLDSSEEDGGSDDDAASNASSADDYNFKSMLPYFRRTTQHYHTVLSPYNQVQMALVGWVNSRTVAFVVGVGLGPLNDPGPALPDAAYAAEADGAAPPDAASLQARGVLLQLLAAPLRDVCGSLAVRVAQSDVDRKLAALVASFRVTGPVPSFKPAQWHLLALALLHALSRHHIPALRASLCAAAAAADDGKREGEGDDAAVAAAARVPSLRGGGGLTAASAHPRLLGLLDRIGFDVHYLASLVDLLVSPEF
ncbi:hypothetical protein GPECTOR_13g799 [Gonium pectorale]|uniref:protein-serine/threonine phosphatase n=1 Tax=Gonium pectorale TaxID=33097 RepID=A0A150GNK4_GONPE|nr:hypothetical protein GPECTOR_13g799 [Gonium pectorale]|eukprot:KXZ51312.1 hypothetical protein GPECTOR_13g799 [Gonium pectorale]